MSDFFQDSSDLLKLNNSNKNRNHLVGVKPFIRIEPDSTEPNKSSDWDFFVEKYNERLNHIKYNRELPGFKNIDSLTMTHKKYKIAITGSFAAGKTTFVSTLLGEKIPLTPTREVIGSKLEIAKINVEILDLVGEVFVKSDEIHQDLITRIIPDADIVILMATAHRGFSKDDIDFLNSKVSLCDLNKFLFILNRKDQLSEEDCSDVLNYTKAQLQAVISEPQLFLVSSKEAFSFRHKEKNRYRYFEKRFSTIEQTGFIDFEKALLSKLRNKEIL